MNSTFVDVVSMPTKLVHEPGVLAVERVGLLAALGLLRELFVGGMR
jgi:hypothetical protein